MMSELKKLDHFRKYLFDKAGLSDEDFLLLVPEIDFKVITKGVTLLYQEEFASQVYFVSSGLLRSFTIDSNGKQSIIQFAPENWWIGDRNSFLFQEPSQMIIDTIEDSELIILKQSFYEIATKRIPSFSSFNLRALHNQNRFMQRRITSLLSATAEDRYLEFLELHPQISLRVPQWMIASYLGITPESLSRVRTELSKKKFLR